jgi:hypothetical protein
MPYGRWEVTGIYALGPSGDAEDVKDVYKDMAVLQVASSPAEGGGGGRGAGKALQDRAGYFTPLLNRGGNFRFTNLGYPANEPYSGHEMFFCDGTSRTAEYDDARVLQTDNCATAGGNSGGPWIRHYREYNLIGVLSDGTGPSDEPESQAPPLAPETFGRLLARADPTGTSLGHYDDLAFLRKRKAHTPEEPETVQRGDSMTQTVTVDMRGKLAHADVPVTFRLSEGQTFRSAEGASCKLEGQTVRCTLRDMHPGTSQQRSIDIRVKVADKAPERLTTTAEITSSDLDQNKADNTVTLEARTEK